MHLELMTRACALAVGISVLPARVASPPGRPCGPGSQGRARWTGLLVSWERIAAARPLARPTSRVPRSSGEQTVFVPLPDAQPAPTSTTVPTHFGLL